MTIVQFAKTTPVTFTLIAIIVGYFVVQVMVGVQVDTPSFVDLIRFGANFLPLNLDEPWRFVVSGFLHIGLMHLVFNSFALYFFGQVVEHLLGAWRLLAVFVLSVVAGNLVSAYVQWHGIQAGAKPVISAGASGGIMGLGCALLVMSLMPRFDGRLNTKSLIWIMAVNLVMGFALATIDNAAHIGGAVCGGLMAAAFARDTIATSTPKSAWVCVAVAVGLLIGYVVLTYSHHQT